MACLPEDLIEQQFIEAEAETAIHISGTAHKRPFIVTTDSISDLPVDITGQYEIRVMPYYISTGHGRFRDIEEIDADNLQQTFVENISGVSSEAAPVEEYETFFGNALAEARYVIHLSSSKNISEAYNRAAAAAESFGNVKVIDSGTTSTELGLMAIRTAEMLRQGMRMEEIDKDLEQYTVAFDAQQTLNLASGDDGKMHYAMLDGYTLSLNKKAKDYSKIDKRIKMSALFKKPWMAKQSILESMEKRIDRAIVKVDSLHKEAELNNMLKLYDRLESKIESTREAVVMPMVADNEVVYGAEAFDKYMENHNATMQSKDKADRIAGKVVEVKNEGK